MDDTFERAWRVVSVLPERELTMMPSASVATNYHGSLRAENARADVLERDATNESAEHRG
jgi:hypothetical protein